MYHSSHCLLLNRADNFPKSNQKGDGASELKLLPFPFLRKGLAHTEVLDTDTAAATENLVVHSSAGS